VTHINFQVGSSYTHLEPLTTRAKEAGTHTLLQPPLINRVARDFHAASPSPKTWMNQKTQHARGSTNSWNWKTQQGTRRQDIGYPSPTTRMNQEYQHARSSTHSWNWTPEHGTRKQDTGCSTKARIIGTCSTTVRTIPDRWTGTLPIPNQLPQHKLHSLSTPPQPHQDMYARSTTKRKSSRNRHSQHMKLQLKQNNQPTQLQNDFNLTKQTKI